MKREKINYNGYLVYKHVGKDCWDIPYPCAGRRLEKTISRLPSGQMVFCQGAILEYVDSFEDGMKMAIEHDRPYVFQA